MVQFAPAGIPLSCKGRTLIEGMEDVLNLGMKTLEVQLVRKLTDDHLSQFWAAGQLARQIDFRFTIHAPYYIELLGNERTKRESLAAIEKTGHAAKELGADLMVTHIGPYNDMGHEEAMEEVINSFHMVNEIFQENEINCRIGLECSGRQDLFGELDEILEVCNHVSNTLPVLNWAHLHARGDGAMKSKDDFERIIELVTERTGITEFYTHFSGVAYDQGEERHFTQIKKGDLKFEHLAELILDANPDITIVCDSPLLEHDAMYMNVILSRVKQKRDERRVREALARQRTAEEEGGEEATAE